VAVRNDKMHLNVENYDLEAWEKVVLRVHMEKVNTTRVSATLLSFSTRC
jgi:hypothetical protein